MNFKLVFIFLATITLSLNVNGQDSKVATNSVAISAPSVALIKLEGTPSVALAPMAPEEAGGALDFSGSINSELWINVSSVVGSMTKTTRDVTAAIATGGIPAGLQLKVVAAADAGQGDGSMGLPSATLTLNTTAQNFIIGFGTCFTGEGANKGYRLSYSLVKNSYVDIKFDNGQTISVAYTISD